MGDRPVFTEFACFQLAAGIAIGSCDPPISRCCARRRLDPLAAIFKGAERIQVLNGIIEGIFSLGYLIIVLPLLGSGLGITASSWGQFWRQKNLEDEGRRRARGRVLNFGV